MKNAFLFLFALLSIGGPGCEDPAATTPASSPLAPVSEEAFAGTFTSRVCDAYQRCCQAPGGFDRAECDKNAGHFTEKLTKVSIGSGRIYRPEEGARCVASFEALVSRCTAGLEIEDAEQACADAFRASAPDGTPCDGSGDCLPGLLCSLRGDLMVCLSTPPKLSPGDPCVGKLKSGQRAAVNGLCPDAYLCDHDTEKCVPKPTAGQPCSSDRCGDGLLCVQGVCSALKAQGEACSSSLQCSPEFACDVSSTSGSSGAGGASGSCAPRKAQGQACKFDEDCAAGLDCRGSICDVKVRPFDASVCKDAELSLK